MIADAESPANCRYPVLPGTAPVAVVESLSQLPGGWREVLADEVNQPWFHALARLVEQERKTHEVFPAAEDVYAALNIRPTKMSAY